MRINEIKVHRSMWVTIPTVLIILFLGGLLESGVYSSWISIWEMFLNVSGGMLIGAIVWEPSMIVWLLIEKSMMNASTTKSELEGLLFFEALIPVLIINALFFLLGRGDIKVVMGTFFIAIIVQLVRWFYINQKEGLYVIESDENIHLPEAVLFNPKS
jgi:hypothetical protein